MKQKGSKLGGLVLMATLATPAHAVGTTVSLDTVRVEGQRLEEALSSELGRYGSRVEVVTREDIEEAGVIDVAQALQMLVPGLHLAPKHGRFDYGDVSLHGSRSQDILYLVDGIRVNNRLFGGTSPLDTLGTNMVERIEVLKGGQSLFYGTQAVAGVVNIVTRAFRDSPEGEVAIGAGTIGEKQLEGWVADGDDGHRFVLSGSHARSDGYQPFRDEHIEESARNRSRGYEVTSLGARYQREFSLDQRLTVSYINTDAAVDFARATDNFDTVNDRNQQLLTVNWDQFIGNNLAFSIKAYGHRWDTEYTRLYTTDDPDLVEVVNDADFWGFEDYGLNAMIRAQQQSGSEWVFGLDTQRYSGEDQVLLIETQTETVNALFGQYRPNLSSLPNTRLAVGARHSEADLGGSNTVWNISGQHDFDVTYLRGTAGIAFRLPDAYQLFSIDPDHPRGNENLDGEESEYIELGYGGAHRLQSSNVSWELMGWYREIRDLIGADVVDGSFTFVNTDNKVLSQGIEISARLTTDGGWRGSVNLNRANARERGSSEQIDRIPKSFAKASVGRDHNQGQWGWLFSGIHVGEVSQFLGDVGRETYGNHTIVDANLWWRPSIQSGHRVGLRIENMFDNTYASGVTRARRDADDSWYRVDNLGVPRNAQLRYSYAF
jgi:vitamin B12 transporter